MKISCEFNEILYIFNTFKGQVLSDKYKLMLSREEKLKMENGEMDYFTLHLEAVKNDQTLIFEFQGIALSFNPEEQAQEIQEYLEDQLIFSKIEEKFKLAQNNSSLPSWAKK